MNTHFRTWLRWVAEGAPYLTLGLLAALPWLLPNRTVIDPHLLSHQHEIALAMEDLPYAMGAWAGTDVAIPPAAIKLLHPNAIFSRRYERIPSGPVVNVLMVHCSDMRDMEGHYPPRCYPSSGWTPRGDARGEMAELSLDGMSIPVQCYEFVRMLEHGGQGGIRIFNLFVLPDGTVSRRMDDIYEQSERPAMSVRGAAQIQLVTPITLTKLESIEAANQVLAGMKPFFERLGVKRSWTHVVSSR